MLKSETTKLVLLACNDDTFGPLEITQLRHKIHFRPNGGIIRFAITHLKVSNVHLFALGESRFKDLSVAKVDLICAR